MVTYLSGDNLHEKRHTNFSFTGILDAIPVRHDQIANFYAKFKMNKKWKAPSTEEQENEINPSMTKNIRREDFTRILRRTVEEKPNCASVFISIQKQQQHAEGKTYIQKKNISKQTAYIHLCVHNKQIFV